ncbi:rhomboid family intramembrane serine protease [Luteolibacter pohnpeiensis]|nr:rhomboid family intramembrane serine protease [Luteolibacter pohnpeiensis]
MGLKMMNFKYLMRQQGVLLGLIGLMFLIFFAQCLFGNEWWEGGMAVPGEVVRAWNHLRSGSASSVDFKEFPTLLSCAFLHGSFEHVLFNMIWFWIFGALLVELLGWRWMLGIFLTTAFFGSLTHVILNREEFVPMLGASGSVMGFEGAYLGLAIRWPLPNPHIWPIASPVSPATLGLLAAGGVFMDYTSLMDGSEMSVAYGAHIGGFISGLLIAGLIAPRPRVSIPGFRRF